MWMQPAVQKARRHQPPPLALRQPEVPLGAEQDQRPDVQVHEGVRIARPAC